ncbi:MAG: nucleoside phosphorylase [Cyclobacteriaceae bacterium]
MEKPKIAESELIINKDGSIYHLNLKPGQVAMDIIGVGDPERVGKISRYFDRIELKVQNREFVTHTGYYNGKRLSVISTGMGTDNIEIFMTELDALFNVNFHTRLPEPKHTKLNIIRIGTSGSMQAHVPAGALLASEYALGLDTLMIFYNLDYSDLEKQIGEWVQKKLNLSFTPYCVKGSDQLFELFKDQMITGITVTCPGFFGPQGRKIRLDPAIPNIFDLLGSSPFKGFQFTNFEMETAGYYAMGKLLGHEVLSLNAIVANRIHQTFDANTGNTMERLISLVLQK